MKLNHVAKRLDARHFDTIVDMFKVKLGMLELRRNERCVWLRQPGANIDLQFTVSDSCHRDGDKKGSQVAFLSVKPRDDLEDLAKWLHQYGLDTRIGYWSDKEFFLDIPAALVDFVIEAMTPEMAEYSISALSD